MNISLNKSASNKSASSKSSLNKSNDASLKRTSPHDKAICTGVTLGQAQQDQQTSDEALLKSLTDCLGNKKVMVDQKANRFYRKGWRSGEGVAVAVLFPGTLLQLWQTIKICVAHNTIMIMQAANTGLTEGSTPNGSNYDRPVVVINTLSIVGLCLLEDNTQVISLPGTTLHHLEAQLQNVGRSPHSVIGSSCLGASIIGGIANNSGGALVKRGPAYTECSVYAQINENGELVFVNHLGVELGDSPEQILENLSNACINQQKPTSGTIEQGNRLSSDSQYTKTVRDIHANSPSRYNANPERLYEASGCAGKIAVFAVRVDTHGQESKHKTFYIGTNDVSVLTALRREMLGDMDNLPDVAEYMHRDMFDISQKYGKDTYLSVKHLGTKRLPKLFTLKAKVDAFCEQLSFLPKNFSDRSMQWIASLFPQHLPTRLIDYKREYEHHLILKVSDDAIEETTEFLRRFFENKSKGSFFECNDEEEQGAFLNRFAAAGAAIRYQVMHQPQCGELLALDVALRRNDMDWYEKLPKELDDQLDKKLYYGHFFCHVFHQDYVLKSGADPTEVKKQMLKLFDQRGAKYPAEHNVGHLYDAENQLKEFYRHLDPTNTFNPGIGKMEKTQRNCGCC